MKPVRAALSLIWLGTSCLAQQPLSAIEWLNDAVAIPVVQPNPYISSEPPVSGNADIPDVSVLPLDAARPDSVGLLPSSITGLPETLWQNSRTDDLTALLARIPSNPLPAIQALLYTLLLAEAEAPSDARPDAMFLKSRVRALVNFGAVDPAQALLERAGTANKTLYNEWFDLTLLNGEENKSCAVLRDQPELSQSYAARIYCAALNGDWPTAALTYDTATALNLLTKTEANLLAQFLDPELIDAAATTAPPQTMTPLMFRLFEANGTPVPTRGLSRAYAMADLRNTAGWKAEIEAAERLARTGALAPNRLLGLYTDRKPAASGGVWDRVSAVQHLDNALISKRSGDAAKALPKAWEAMRAQGLEVGFAQLFAAPLLKLDLPAQSRPLALRIALLSPDYEDAARALKATNDREAFMLGLARGAPDAALATTGLQRAIVAAFAATGPARAHEPLLRAGKLGQAILSAAIGLDRASAGNPADITASLRTLRAVGLENTARRSALQLLILGHAG